MTDRVLPAGVAVAMVTPLDDRGKLDEAALERLLGRVAAAGVVGVSPCGSTGEGTRLTRGDRLAVLRAVVRRLPPGFPVIPGVAVAALDDAGAELAEAADSGASAALVAPPSYYPSAPDDLERLYVALADASPVPLVLYNNPAMTKTSIPVSVVRAIAGHPRIAGIKDSSRDLEYLQAVLLATQDADFSVLTGSDTMLVASLLLGAHGTIAASANLVPELSVAICAAMRAGEIDRALAVQRQLFAVVTACRRGTTPAGWKAALQLAGVCSARLAAPADQLTGPDARALAAELADLLPSLAQ